MQEASVSFGLSIIFRWIVGFIAKQQLLQLNIKANVSYKYAVPLMASRWLQNVQNPQKSKFIILVFSSCHGHTH